MSVVDFSSDVLVQLDLRKAEKFIDVPVAAVPYSFEILSMNYSFCEFTQTKTNYLWVGNCKESSACIPLQWPQLPPELCQCDTNPDVAISLFQSLVANVKNSISVGVDVDKCRYKLETQGSLAQFCNAYDPTNTFDPNTLGAIQSLNASPSPAINAHLAMIVISGVILILTGVYDGWEIFRANVLTNDSFQGDLVRNALRSCVEDTVAQAMAWLAYIILASRACTQNVQPQLTPLVFSLVASMVAQGEPLTKVIAAINTGATWSQVIWAPFCFFGTIILNINFLTDIVYRMNVSITGRAANEEATLQSILGPIGCVMWGIGIIIGIIIWVRSRRNKKERTPVQTETELNLRD